MSIYRIFLIRINDEIILIQLYLLKRKLTILTYFIRLSEVILYPGKQIYISSLLHYSQVMHMYDNKAKKIFKNEVFLFALIFAIDSTFSISI